jgi:RHS repeat-associated protein
MPSTAQNTSLNYYPFGSVISSRAFASGEYRYGINGMEKDSENNSGAYDFGARVYNGRIGRWLSVDQFIAKFPFASPYNFVLNNSLIAIDPDGRDVVFINGFSNHDNNNKFRGGSVSAWRKNKYWNNTNKNFTNKIGNYFNDDKNHFLSASQMYGSKAKNRQQDGYKTAIQMVKLGEIILSTDNPITVVMHSQGNAFGAGYMQGILDAAKEAKIDVKVNGVMLSVHQPNQINTDGIKDKSIQFTYGDDNSKTVAPMGKTPGIADANPDNINNSKGGLDAHSATIDKDEAFEAIKKVDKEKKIFTKKGDL